MLVISAITFIFCAESVGADDFDGGIIALYALIVLLPTEIVVIIISTIVYYAKKKKYNAAEEKISEDNSDETKL